MLLRGQVKHRVPCDYAAEPARLQIDKRLAKIAMDEQDRCALRREHGAHFDELGSSD